MPGFTGIDALGIFRAARLDIPFILISGTMGESTAVAAMKAGASDYIMKASLARLGPALERELKETQMRAAHRQAIEELRRSENLKGAILESSLDCVITMDHEGKIVEFNPAAEATFGLAREQAIGKDMVELIVPRRLRDAHRRGFARYLATGEGPILGKRLELAAIRADGTEFPIELAITALGAASTPMFTGLRSRHHRAQGSRDENQAPEPRVRGAERHQHADRARARPRRAVQGGLPDRGRARRIPHGLDRHRRPERDEDRARSPRRAMAEEFLDSHQGPLSLREDDAAAEIPWPRGRSGRRRPSSSNDVASDPDIAFAQGRCAERGIRSIADPAADRRGRGGRRARAVRRRSGFFDEEEMKLLTELAGDIAFAIDHIDKQERLDYLAYYDVLTGLANRSLFLERVAQYMRSAASGGHKLAVFLIDLERFKNINDSLGRPAGDALLKQVAEWLTRNVGDANLLARVGADHFAVVLPEVQAGRRRGAASREDDGRLSSSIRSAWTTPCSGSPPRSASRCSRMTAPTPTRLFRNAEAALKKAKASGDRYLFYTQKMTDSGGRQAHAGKPAAPGARQGRIRAPLPAQGEPRERQAHRRRGADPLERSAHRAWCRRASSSRSWKKPD